MAHGGSTTAVIVIALLSLALAAQGWPCSWLSHQVSLPSESRQDGHIYTVAKQLTVNWTASDSNCSFNGKPTTSRSWVLSSGNISCESKRIGHPECTIIVLQADPTLKTVVVQSIPFTPANHTSHILSVMTARTNVTLSATANSPHAIIFEGSSSAVHFLEFGPNGIGIGVRGTSDLPSVPGVYFSVKVTRARLGATISTDVGVVDSQHKMIQLSAQSLTTQAATLDPNTAVELHRILEPNGTEFSGTSETMLSTITERNSATRKVAALVARKPKRLHKYQRISDTTASLHLDLARGSASIINVTTYAAKEQLGKVAFTELWDVKQVPVSIHFLNVTSAATSIPETLEEPGKFALNMTRSKFSIFVRDMKAKNIRILHCDGQTVSKGVTVVNFTDTIQGSGCVMVINVSYTSTNTGDWGTFLLDMDLMLPPQPHHILGTRGQIITTVLSAAGGLCAVVILMVLYVRYKTRTEARRQGYTAIAGSTNRAPSDTNRGGRQDRRRQPLTMIGEIAGSEPGSPRLAHSPAIQRQGTPSGAGASLPQSPARQILASTGPFLDASGVLTPTASVTDSNTVSTPVQDVSAALAAPAGPSSLAKSPVAAASLPQTLSPQPSPAPTHSREANARGDGAAAAGDGMEDEPANLYYRASYDAEKLHWLRRQHTLVREQLDRMLADSTELQQQFLSLRTRSKTGTTNVASLEEHRRLNRYSDILAADHSRVVLVPRKEASHNYINANFISGANGPHSYIAAQGPTQHTVNDFYRMIWDHKVCAIVMLCKPLKRQCEPYWNDKREYNSGQFAVHVRQKSSAATHAVRIMELRLQPDAIVKNEEKSRDAIQPRTLHHYAFRHWPDHGTPSAAALLDFLLDVKNETANMPGPLLVHCSAGVGRTGTYIALDQLLDAIDDAGEMAGRLDVFETVRHLREQRAHMVQMSTQYHFLFKCLEKHLECMIKEA